MVEKNTEQKIRFYELFAQLVSAMTDFDAINIPLIESLLVELCVLLRLSKAETFLYNSLEEEKQGKGAASIRERENLSPLFALNPVL